MVKVNLKQVSVDFIVAVLELICRVNPPLPVLAFTRFPDKTNGRCLENLLYREYGDSMLP
jgi:hypothetical protein